MSPRNLNPTSTREHGECMPKRGTSWCAMHAHTHPHTHTHTETGTHTEAHKDTHRGRHTHTHTQIQTRTHTRTVPEAGLHRTGHSTKLSRFPRVGCDAINPGVPELLRHNRKLIPHRIQGREEVVQGRGAERRHRELRAQDPVPLPDQLEAKTMLMHAGVFREVETRYREWRGRYDDQQVGVWCAKSA